MNKLLIALSFVLLMWSCTVVPAGPDPLDPELAELSSEELFSAAAEAGVPRDLLVAMAWNSSSFAPSDPDHPTTSTSSSSPASCPAPTGGSAPSRYPSPTAATPRRPPASISSQLLLLPRHR